MIWTKKSSKTNTCVYQKKKAHQHVWSSFMVCHVQKCYNFVLPRIHSMSRTNMYAHRSWVCHVPNCFSFLCFNCFVCVVLVCLMLSRFFCVWCAKKENPKPKNQKTKKPKQRSKLCEINLEELCV